MCQSVCMHQVMKSSIRYFYAKILGKDPICPRNVSSLEINCVLDISHLMGFGDIFLQTNQAIYASPRAKVKVNGLTLPPQSLSRGTHQGCPLSPILFG